MSVDHDTQAAIYGLDALAMPENWTPLEAIAVIRCLDEDGDTALLLRSTEGVRVWDAVGMLTVALDTERQSAARNFLDDEDEEDEG